jgi:excisionase family DNA binding protein
VETGAPDELREDAYDDRRLAASVSLETEAPAPIAQETVAASTESLAPAEAVEPAAVVSTPAATTIVEPPSAPALAAEALAPSPEPPAPAALASPERLGDTPAALAPEPAAPATTAARAPVAAGTPDVLRNIQEAALIRQRLPQHMEMLLRIPTNEVAQNSYKSPFRESREDLIGRLLDPQLTLEEAARILGVCPTTVRRYTNRGMLHCHRTPGNQRRFRMSDVLQFLEQYGDRIDRAAEARQFEEAA